MEQSAVTKGCEARLQRGLGVDWGPPSPVHVPAPPSPSPPSPLSFLPSLLLLPPAHPIPCACPCPPPLPLLPSCPHLRPLPHLQLCWFLMGVGVMAPPLPPLSTPFPFSLPPPSLPPRRPHLRHCWVLTVVPLPPSYPPCTPSPLPSPSSPHLQSCWVLTGVGVMAPRLPPTPLLESCGSWDLRTVFNAL